MGGALWSTWRSVRGIEVTWQYLGSSRWSDRGISDIVGRHVNDGIAADGTPTGVEHTFRWESFQPDLVMLMSRWRDATGALRFRELYRAAKDQGKLIDALHEAAWSTVQGPQHPVRAQAVDLDVLFGLARASSDLDDLARRWSSDLRFRDIPLPRCFPAGYRPSGQNDPLTQQLKERRAATSGLEAELLALIEADPANTGQLAVYGDWLEQAGRNDEAAVVRARI